MDQVMAWCLIAPSHYLNQLWFIISEFCGIHMRTISQKVPKLITVISPRGQWVNAVLPILISLCKAVVYAVWKRIKHINTRELQFYAPTIIHFEKRACVTMSMISLWFKIFDIAFVQGCNLFKGAMRFGTFKSIDFKKNWYVKVPVAPVV